MKFNIAAIIIASLLAAQAQAAELRPKIAILPFDNSLDKKFGALGEGMPDVLTACFTTENIPADILDRSALAAISQEQTINFDASKFTKAEGATHLLRGSLAPQDNGILMTLMLYDLASTKLVASASVVADTGAVAEEACAGVRKLGAQLPALNTVEAPETGLDGKAAGQSRLMIEGLGAYYNGAYEKAFAPFLKLVREDPGNASALYWLAKSYAGAGMADEAKLEFGKFLAAFPTDARASEVAAILKDKGE